MLLRALTVLLAAPLMIGATLQAGTGTGIGGTDLLEQMGLGDRGPALEDGPFVLQGTGCHEAQVIVEANATELAERLPAGVEPRQPGRLVAGVIACERMTLNWSASGAQANASVHEDVAIGFLSALTEQPLRSTARGDHLLALYTDEDRLAGALAAAGVPVTPVDEVSMTEERTHSIASSFEATIRGPGADFSIRGSAVSIQAATSLGTGPSMGLELAYRSGEAGHQVVREVDTERVGGVSGELDAIGSQALSGLLDRPVASGSGIYAQHTMRLGVV